MVRLYVPALLVAGAEALKAADGTDWEQVHVVPGRTADNKVIFHINDGPAVEEASAFGTFEDQLVTHGWGKLNIETNNKFPDLDQAFSAGLIEGYLTSRDIYELQFNLYPEIFGEGVAGYDDVKPEIVEWMDRQEAWTRVMVSQLSNEDDFWAHVGFVLAQYDGLIEGYNEAARRGLVPHIHRFAFAMLNGVGDLFDVIPAASLPHRVNWLNMSTEEAELQHARVGHCSGLIKLPGDFSDLLMSHSSWFTYSNTNRIFKHYHLNFNNQATAARRISFSSYPGYLESLDDFYLLDSGLGWIQTTNTVLDHSQYDHVKPESLLAWQRVRVASAMSHTGEEWYKHLKTHFSGTYANQYMIVDFKLFTPRKPIKPNTLWVVEEMPGLVVGGDRSETLSYGYWPSYNVPYWPEVYNKSGYVQMVDKHGVYFSYEMCPRAQIFRRDQGFVNDIPSLKRLMRSNNFMEDPYSLDGMGRPNPTYAICSRGDLHPSNASADGCYDTKVTSYNFGALHGHAEAINSPPEIPSIPPFSWTNPKFQRQRHAGLPEEYLFDFVDIRPAEPKGFAAAKGQKEATPNMQI